MAITYGFFNSLDGDRTYNADQMSNMFEGLISDGVYESVGNAFAVTASSGLTVTVGSGRAMVDAKWIKNDANTTLSLTAAHVTLNRYTAIVLRKNLTTRDVTLIAVDGANASSPTKPAPTRNTTTYDLILAYVYVKAGATSISQSNITDTRANTSLCGFVTGLIEQVDTTSLFTQYQTAYSEMLATMQSWFAAQQSSFDSWFNTLTSDLQVGAYVRSYEKAVTLATGATATITLDMANYTYESSDIIMVYINGLRATPITDYLINTSSTPVEIDLNISTSGTNSNDVFVQVLKSYLGNPPTGSGSSTSATASVD